MSPSTQTPFMPTQAPSEASLTTFHLEAFEYHVHRGTVEDAARELLFLLNQLDRSYGQWGEHFQGYAPGQDSTSIGPHLCTRLAGAITTLFCRADFAVSDSGFHQLMALHRWLALIFAVSSYRHGDHIIRNLNAAGGGCISPLTLNQSNLRLFCLSYYPDSQIPLQPDALWNYDRQTIVMLFFVLLSGRALPTPAAHQKREQLLAWLPEHLLTLDSLDFLPVAILHDVYMHCSYADLEGKHQIKRSINQLIRQTLLRQGYQGYQGYQDIECDWPQEKEKWERVEKKTGRAGKTKKATQGKEVIDNEEKAAQSCEVRQPLLTTQSEKPVMLVVLEWFTCQHSVYRTHSASLRALRDTYTLHAVALTHAIDEVSADVFDVCHRVEAEQALDTVYALAKSLNPAVMYYVGIGMFPYTIYLSNLRLAPLQIVGLGHGASTFATCIDAFVVDEDFVGDPDCFSERVVALSIGAMPFVPPNNIMRHLPQRIPFTVRQQNAWPQALPVRVAVCASIMKVNPGFLDTLAEIVRRSVQPVQFCFYMGFAHGLTLDYLRTAIHAVLPTAEVNAHMPVQVYQQALNSCELFVNPFPYGNMNGVVDVVRQGLPGVCLSGPEVHTHIDEGLFRRLGLPEALIAPNTQAYVNAALKLIEAHDYRETLQTQLLKNDTEATLFEGTPHRFVEAVQTLQSSLISSKMEDKTKEDKEIANATRL